jgi:hypothetical protein
VIFSLNASEEKWHGCHSKILIVRSSTKLMRPPPTNKEQNLI